MNLRPSGLLSVFKGEIGTPQHYQPAHRDEERKWRLPLRLQNEPALPTHDTGLRVYRQSKSQEEQSAT